LLVAANLIAVCASRGFAAGFEVDFVRVAFNVAPQCIAFALIWRLFGQWAFQGSTLNVGPRARNGNSRSLILSDHT
jgi:hypothetical protein